MRIPTRFINLLLLTALAVSLPGACQDYAVGADTWFAPTHVAPDGVNDSEVAAGGLAHSVESRRENLGRPGDSAIQRFVHHILATAQASGAFIHTGNKYSAVTALEARRADG